MKTKSTKRNFFKMGLAGLVSMGLVELASLNYPTFTHTLTSENTIQEIQYRPESINYPTSTNMPIIKNLEYKTPHKKSREDLIKKYQSKPTIEYDFSKDSKKTSLARILYGEARNILKTRDQREAIMIAFTVINRANDRFKWNGRNIKEVILKNKPTKTKTGKTIYIHQYSCFNAWDPNLKELKNPEKYDPKSWERALSLSEKILEGKLTHLNYGQSHYIRKGASAFWTKSPRMKKIWGQPSFKHEFYRDTKA